MYIGHTCITGQRCGDVASNCYGCTYILAGGIPSKEYVGAEVCFKNVME